MLLRHSRGNALFIVLLAVVLFGALSFAISNSMQGGGKDVSPEKAKVYAAEIMQYGNAAAATVARLLNNNECEDNEISFVNSVYSGYTNGYSPSDGRCNVFGTSGGGLSVLTISTQWLDPYFGNSPWGSAYYYGMLVFPGNQSIANVGTYTQSASASSNVDLLMEVPFISNNVCKAINKQVGMPYPLYATNPTNGNTIGMFDQARFIGRYTSCYPSDCNYFASLRAQLSSSSPILTPPAGFCMTGTFGAGNPESGKQFNVYTHVLIAR